MKLDIFSFDFPLPFYYYILYFFSSFKLFLFRKLIECHENLIKWLENNCKDNLSVLLNKFTVVTTKIGMPSPTVCTKKKNTKICIKIEELMSFVQFGSALNFSTKRLF